MFSEYIVSCIACLICDKGKLLYNKKSVSHLLAVIDEMNDQFPRPSLKIELSPLVDLFQQQSLKNIPNVGQAGVYCFFDANHNVLYIGSASCDNTMLARIKTYFSISDSPPNIQVLNGKGKDVRYVGTIGLPADRRFEAPSIEQFLISRIIPKYNTHGSSQDFLEFLAELEEVEHTT